LPEYALVGFCCKLSTTLPVNTSLESITFSTVLVKLWSGCLNLNFSAVSWHNKKQIHDLLSLETHSSCTIIPVTMQRIGVFLFQIKCCRYNLCNPKPRVPNLMTNIIHGQIMCLKIYFNCACFKYRPCTVIAYAGIWYTMKFMCLVNNNYNRELNPNNVYNRFIPFWFVRELLYCT